MSSEELTREISNTILPIVQDREREQFWTGFAWGGVFVGCLMAGLLLGVSMWGG